MIPLTGHQGCLIVCAAACLMAGAAGWTLQGWRLSGQIERLHADHAAYVTAVERSRADAESKYRQAERDAAQAVAQAQNDYQEALHHAKTETDALRAAVAAGDRRLLVRARCTDTYRVSADASPGPGADAASAELDAAARPDYFALVAGIRQSEQQIVALQQYARACHLLTNQAH